MRLAAFVGVYEAEAEIASITLDQLVTLCRRRGVDLALTILDDASPSHLGDRLAQRLGPSLRRGIDVVRLERSTGYYGQIDRTLDMFRRLVESGLPCDYLLRLDVDLHFCRDDVGKLFDASLLPRRGIVGATIQMRYRDYVQVYADLAPFGFRRRERNGLREHGWELRRSRPVWFWRIAGRGIRNGFRGRFVAGPFQLIAWETLLEVYARGYLSCERQRWGLIFGEDIMTNLLVLAAGHPVVDASAIIPDWSCELFLPPSATAQDVRNAGYFFVHPVKDRPWANEIRRQITI